MKKRGKVSVSLWGAINLLHERIPSLRSKRFIAFVELMSVSLVGQAFVRHALTVCKGSK